MQWLLVKRATDDVDVASTNPVCYFYIQNFHIHVAKTLKAGFSPLV